MKRLFGGDIKMEGEGKRKKISLPERGTLYDYKYQKKPSGNDFEWINWVDLIDKTESIPPKMIPS